MTKAILFCVLILVVPTLAMGGILAVGAESGPLGAFAGPFLYLGCLVAWLMEGDTFVNSQEFLWSGFKLSLPINTVLGVLMGVMIGLIKNRFTRLREIRA